MHEQSEYVIDNDASHSAVDNDAFHSVVDNDASHSAEPTHLCQVQSLRQRLEELYSCGQPLKIAFDRIPLKPQFQMTNYELRRQLRSLRQQQQALAADLQQADQDRKRLQRQCNGLQTVCQRIEVTLTEQLARRKTQEGVEGVAVQAHKSIEVQYQLSQLVGVKEKHESGIVLELKRRIDELNKRKNQEKSLTAGLEAELGSYERKIEKLDRDREEYRNRVDRKLYEDRKRDLEQEIQKLARFIGHHKAHRLI